MKKTILSLILASFAVVSCNLEEVLSLTPESQLTPDSYFTRAEDLQLFSNTFYNNLLEKAPYSIESDVFVKMNPSNLIRGGTDRTVPTSGGGWSFTNLRKMNTLLANIDHCDDAAAVKEYTALTRFWRAYYYADMIRKFGDVPWIDHEIGSADEDLYAPRDTREEVMKHIIEDIDCAIEDLPDKAKAPQTAYRVNKYTAMFLKAQFCLFEGTFRKYHSSPAPFENSYTAADGSTHDADYYLGLAADAAKLLIDSKAYKLFSTGKPNSDYLTLFNSDNANTDEIILAVNFDSDLKIKHDLGRDITNQTAARYGMTKKLVDMYLMADGTRFTDKPGWNVMAFADEVAGRDSRLAQTIRTPGYSWKRPGTSKDGPEFAYCQSGYQTIKYIPAYDTKPYSTDNCFNDMPVFRYAEALLNYAEAKAELGTLTQDDLDISVNLIRKRVGMPDLNKDAANANPDNNYLGSAQFGYTNVTGSNKGVILEIRRERAIELFQEGYGRYFDLMRWKAGYCLNQPYWGMYIPGPGAYDFGDDSKYTFYVGSSAATGVRYQIHDPAVANETATDEMFYLVDPNTGNDATAGVRDILRTVPHSFDESKHYFYPLNEKDLQLNTNLKQNPNW